ncbi:rod-binding protein [Asaia spathodeae]|uniref:Rod-binding protein n=1 Tax=Asaia spathodeae TaxID=657016 RepID=A0ABX2P5S7_9PROT|nr:rod-binding protein [Asaia spathodeae]GBR20674.1 chemotactic signal-response protein CheL [Asaia spathodeae NBRC 105894]
MSDSVSALGAASSSRDIAQNAARQAADQARLDKARETAVSFEGITLGELLQPMFDTADTSDNVFGGGAAEKQYRSLQVLEMGKEIAKGGGVGIADSVYRQILAMQEKASS